jgi:hypothetical protein
MSEGILSPYRSVMAAAKELMQVGAFEIVNQRRKHPTEYRVIKHDDYAAIHPEECALCTEEAKRRNLRLEPKKSDAKQSSPRRKHETPSNRIPKAIREQIIRRLTFEWADWFDGSITFTDKDRERLSDALIKWSEDELHGAFAVWRDNWAGDDRYGGGIFAQTADQLCYCVRKNAERKREHEDQRSQEDNKAPYRGQEPMLMISDSDEVETTSAVMES